VPGAKYVGDETIAKIHAYHPRGGRLAIVGPESLTGDEYGRQRDIAAVLRKPIQFGSTPEAYSPQLDYLTGTTPEEYAPQLDKIFEEVGIRRPVRCRDKQGKIAWGVELRAAAKDNQIIVYAINLNREPVEVVMQTKPGACRANELITGQTVPTDRSLTLMPRRPMLLEIGN
jgi:hypothetical protein